jgi:hypothetical protein
MLPYLGEEMETSTVLGSSKSANQNYWSSGLALSEGPNREGISFPSPGDGIRSSFRDAMFSSYFEFRRWTKSVNPTVLNNVIS